MRCAADITWHLRSALCLLLALTGLPAAAGQGYILGIYPYASPSRLEEIYVPAAAELSQAVGRHVEFRTASSIDKFFLQLKAQAYDLALIQPLYYVPAVDEFGYRPLVRMQEPFKALVVVLDSSSLHRVQDLRGKTLATPPAYVPAAILSRRALRERGLTPGKEVALKELATVDACMQQLMIGATDACVTGPLGPAAFQEKYGVKLRTLLETTSLPNLLVVVHKRVPAADRKRMRDAMIAWADTPDGQAVLKSINTHGFVPANERDYQPVRAFVRTLDEPWLPSAP